jgi:hypothetical protein
VIECLFYVYSTLHSHVHVQYIGRQTEGRFLQCRYVAGRNIDTLRVPTCFPLSEKCFLNCCGQFWPQLHANFTSEGATWPGSILSWFSLGSISSSFAREFLARLWTGRKLVTLSFSHEVKDASRGTKLRISPINFEVVISHENGSQNTPFNFSHLLKKCRKI